MKREQTIATGASDTVAHRQESSDLRDAELLKMAAFKVHECAERMLVLARAVQSSALRMKLVSLGHELIQKEEGLHRLEAFGAPHNVPAEPGATLTVVGALPRDREDMRAAR